MYTYVGILVVNRQGWDLRERSEEVGKRKKDFYLCRFLVLTTKGTRGGRRRTSRPAVLFSLRIWWVSNWDGTWLGSCAPPSISGDDSLAFSGVWGPAGRSRASSLTCAHQTVITVHIPWALSGYSKHFIGNDSQHPCYNPHSLGRR